MKAVFCFAVLGSVTMGTPAKADFQLVPTQPLAGFATQDGSRSIALSSESPKQERVQVRRLAPVSFVPIAQGFGKDVPLAFMTRQIVPAKVKVTFGPEVDQAAQVDWKGGRPWVETLQAAVRPLGLRVVVRWMAVSIIRA